MKYQPSSSSVVPRLVLPRTCLQLFLGHLWQRSRPGRMWSWKRPSGHVMNILPSTVNLIRLTLYLCIYCTVHLHASHISETLTQKARYVMTKHRRSWVEVKCAKNKTWQIFYFYISAASRTGGHSYETSDRSNIHLTRFIFRIQPRRWNGRVARED